MKYNHEHLAMNYNHEHLATFTHFTAGTDNLSTREGSNIDHLWSTLMNDNIRDSDCLETLIIDIRIWMDSHSNK